MSYSVPDNLTFEQLVQLKQATDAELEGVRSQVDQATGDAKADLRDAERRLEWKSNIIETRLSRADTAQLRGIVNQHSDAIQDLKADVVKLGDAQAEGKRETGELSERVAFVEAMCLQLRHEHDNLSNEVKKQNILVFGLHPADVQEVLDNIFESKRGLLTLVDDSFFLGNDPAKKKPLKIRFKTISAASDFLKWARTSEFHKDHPTLSAGRDRTTLWRVGVSRLMAATDALCSKYGNALYVHASYDYITLGRVKYDALEFASPCAFFDGELFDVEAACRANPNFAVSDKLSIEQGNTTTSGFHEV
jgi:hypothetical protein